MVPNTVTLEMSPKKAAVERRLTSGNLWTIAVMVAGILGGTGYNHFVPSTAAQHASDASDEAVQKASDAAAKAAVVEVKVAEHTEELGQIMVSMSDLKSDVAVLKSQGADAKNALSSQSDKMDRLLMAVSRMQGATRAPNQQ
jgi:hypothetical protein